MRAPASCGILRALHLVARHTTPAELRLSRATCPAMSCQSVFIDVRCAALNAISVRLRAINQVLSKTH